VATGALVASWLPCCRCGTARFTGRSFISTHYLKAHRSEYYRRPQTVRDEGAWKHWLAFFFVGVSAVAQESAHTGRKMAGLREVIRDRMIRIWESHPHPVSAGGVSVNEPNQHKKTTQEAWSADSQTQSKDSQNQAETR